MIITFNLLCILLCNVKNHPVFKESVNQPAIKLPFSVYANN